MQSWREQKRQARAVVHDTMALDAFLYPQPGATPVPVRVRLHTKFTQIGDDRSQGWAERESVQPRMIFMASELAEQGVSLTRGQLVWLQQDEAYFVDNTLPADDITITAEITRLTRKQYTDAQFGALP